MLIDGTRRALFASSARERRVLVMVLSIGLGFWVQYARTVRGSTMVEKEKDYVAGGARYRHPASIDPVPPRAAERDRPGAGDRHHQSGAPRSSPRRRCRFLGIGLPSTQPSLGTLIQTGQKYLFAGEWWIAIFPASHWRHSCCR